MQSVVLLLPFHPAQDMQALETDSHPQRHGHFARSLERWLQAMMCPDRHIQVVHMIVDRKLVVDHKPADEYPAAVAVEDIRRVVAELANMQRWAVLALQD